MSEKGNMSEIVGLPEETTDDIVNCLMTQWEKHEDVVAVVEALLLKYVTKKREKTAFYAGYALGRRIQLNEDHVKGRDLVGALRELADKLEGEE